MYDSLRVAPSPHMKSNVSTQSIMRDVIIALVPALIAATVLFGYRALVLTAVCVVSCVVFEYLFRMVVKRSNTIGDLSAVVTGMLLAFNLPAGLPIWMAIVGSFVSIVVAKQLFGGLGQNFANPAIVGRIVLMLGFLTQMTQYVVPTVVNGTIERTVGATPLAMMPGGRVTGELPSYLEMFLGLRGGVLGETCVAALLLGGIYLLVRKVIQPTIPVIYIATVFLMSWALGADPVYQILSGGLFLGAIFMATDYATSPVTFKGKVIFAIGCGVITVAIRLYASAAEGVSYSILLMNILTPLIDNATKQKAFGGAKK